MALDILNPTFATGSPSDFGTGLVHFQHDFASDALFGDDALADLIENCPREHYLLQAVLGTEDEGAWSHGGLEGVSGKYALRAIREGRLWLCLQRLDLVAPHIDRLILDAFLAREAENPGLQTSRHRSSLLISSPGASVPYHADIPMIALWHLRGRKRVWLYDAENQDMLPDRALEGIILRESEEEISFDPDWDRQAMCIDLAPGWALSWPHNAPHRVDNLDGLNVSITTDYFTASAQRKYGVYYANGLMRRRLGIKAPSTQTDGILPLVKCGAALGLKKLGVHRAQERELVKRFELDPTTPGDIRVLSASEQCAIHLA